MIDLLVWPHQGQKFAHVGPAIVSSPIVVEFRNIPDWALHILRLSDNEWRQPQDPWEDYLDAAEDCWKIKKITGHRSKGSHKCGQKRMLVQFLLRSAAWQILKLLTLLWSYWRSWRCPSSSSHHCKPPSSCRSFQVFFVSTSVSFVLKHWHFLLRHATFQMERQAFLFHYFIKMPNSWGPSFVGFCSNSKDPYFWCHKVCHKVFDIVKVSSLWQCQKVLCHHQKYEP